MNYLSEKTTKGYYIYQKISLIMKFKILLFAFLFTIPKIIYSQQFKLDQLISLMSTNILFTEKMIYEGNTMLINSSKTSFSYIKKNGEIGASISNPITEGESGDSFISLTETERLKIKFAEEYLEEEKKARTWYSIEFYQLKKQFIGTSEMDFHIELDIQYANKSDYSMISKEIISNSVYENSEVNLDGGYNHVYRNGAYTFTLDTRGRINIFYHWN
jgi:hypothetical protein